jgi:hypothetical protein
VAVDAEAAGDDRHPGVEAPLALERRQRPQGPGEGLLGDLLGLVRIADALLAESGQAGEIAAIQRVERRWITFLEAFDQCPVSDQVDVVDTKRHVWLPDLDWMR